MAVNLLSLAKALGGSLHSTPRKKRSSGRSSYQNQPGNLRRGSHIPGTGIRQDSGLAKKGRSFGGVKDSKIRKVKGRPSHVNTAEARAIDTLGPIGEAWVQSIGSGTINPKTGLPEYGWFSDALKGDWGALGKTKARRARDRAISTAAGRHRTFEAFRRKYENENIAGIFTESEDDDTEKITSPYKSAMNPGFEQFVTDLSGLVKTDEQVAGEVKQKNMGRAMLGIGKSDEDLATAVTEAQEKQKGSNKDDISDYLDVYDPRKQDEALADFNRQGESLGLKKESAFTADTLNQQNIGSQLSSGLFGMLTQAQETESQQNFAGAGNFAQQFAQKQVVQDAERQVNAGKTDREMQMKEMAIQREQIAADLATKTKDVQEQYNQEFWNNMVSWDSAINA